MTINGDTNSADPLLALTDGLKLRSDWPAGLLVHNFSCTVVRNDRLASCDLSMSVVWLSQPPEVPGDYDAVPEQDDPSE